MDEKEYEAMNMEFETKEIEFIIGNNVLEDDILIFDGRKYKIEEINYTDGNLDKIKITPIKTVKEFDNWLQYKRKEYKGKIKGLVK